MMKKSTKRYDVDDNLIYYETDDGHTREFAYDAFGRQIYYNEDGKYTECRLYTNYGDCFYL